jgi:hypothetical protein
MNCDDGVQARARSATDERLFVLDRLHEQRVCQEALLDDATAPPELLAVLAPEGWLVAELDPEEVLPGPWVLLPDVAAELLLDGEEPVEGVPLVLVEPVPAPVAVLEPVSLAAPLGAVPLLAVLVPVGVASLLPLAVLVRFVLPAALALAGAAPAPELGVMPLEPVQGDGVPAAAPPVLPDTGLTVPAPLVLEVAAAGPPALVAGEAGDEEVAGTVPAAGLAVPAAAVLPVPAAAVLLLAVAGSVVQVAAVDDLAAAAAVPLGESFTWVAAGWVLAESSVLAGRTAAGSDPWVACELSGAELVTAAA